MMLCCIQNDPASKISRRLDSSIKQDRKQLQNDVKLLLLGTGESGKSTIAKQMKIIHLKGFSQSEKAAYRAVIHNNILASMHTITDQCLKRYGDQLAAPTKEVATRFSNFIEENENILISPRIAEDMKVLWANEWIQKTFTKAGSEFYVLENIAHYITSLDRIASDGYIPDEQDILRARATTTGVYETEFDVGNAHFRMVDVGGQRTERKKWIHCFEGVTAILFCVGLSEYDQKLIEDDTTSRSQESLQLFGEICNSKWFDETAIILFLNKDDLFREKITKTPITVGFPDYKGSAKFPTCFKATRCSISQVKGQEFAYTRLLMAFMLRAVVAPDDFPFLRELHMATMKELVQQQLGMNEQQQDERLKKDFAEESHKFQIIVVNGEDAGVLWIEDKGTEIYLAMLEIAPKFQNKGLGTLLMNDLVIGPAKAKGITSSLHVLKVNKNALQFYQRLNFQVVAEETNRFKMVLGS